MSRVIVLTPVATTDGLDRSLERELAPRCDVRYLEVACSVDGATPSDGDAVLHAYGATGDAVQRVHAETHRIFHEEDRARPVRVIATGKWWWAARTAAGSLCHHGFRDVQVVAFSPVVSTRLSDYAGVESHMARGHRTVASQWVDRVGVRKLHAVRLNLHPRAGLAVVYPRDSLSDAAVLEAEQHAEWLRHRPDTRVVGLPTSVRELSLLFAPDTELRSEKLYAVDEDTERCLSNGELELARRIRADARLHIQAAVDDPLSWADRLAEAVGVI